MFLQTRRSYHSCGAAAMTVLLLASAVAAQDWPQWRGPARDGVVNRI